MGERRPLRTRSRQCARLAADALSQPRFGSPAPTAGRAAYGGSRSGRGSGRRRARTARRPVIAVSAAQPGARGARTTESAAAAARVALVPAGTLAPGNRPYYRHAARYRKEQRTARAGPAAYGIGDAMTEPPDDLPDALLGTALQ